MKETIEFQCVQINPEITISFPASSTIAWLEVRDGVLEVYYRVKEINRWPPKVRKFRIIGLGETIPENSTQVWSFRLDNIMFFIFELL